MIKNLKIIAFISCFLLSVVSEAQEFFCPQVGFDISNQSPQEIARHAQIRKLNGSHFNPSAEYCGFKLELCQIASHTYTVRLTFESNGLYSRPNRCVTDTPIEMGYCSAQTHLGDTLCTFYRQDRNSGNFWLSQSAPDELVRRTIQYDNKRFENLFYWQSKLD